MGRNKNKPIFRNVTIEGVGAEGKAVAKVNDMVVFTTHVIPGDVVDLQVTKKRSKYREASVIHIHTFSPDRVEAFCEHYGTCGGCKWQILPYEKQLFYKQKQVHDQLSRIGKLILPEINPILGSGKQKFYRNKLEYTFSNKRWLKKDEIVMGSSKLEMNVFGFHILGLFDKVVNVEKCWLQPEPSNQIRDFVYKFSLENRLDFFDIRVQTGFLRNLIIRTATTGELMVILSFFSENQDVMINLLESVKNRFPEITSLQYVINPKPNDTITDQNIETYSGKDFIVEEMEGLKFKIGPKSFYQTNPEQAYNLYKVVRQFAGLTGTETVYDLYTGTGTIGLFLANISKNVVGIEYVADAVQDAQFNASTNNIKNSEFYAGDIKDILNDELVGKHGPPDIIVADPPRSGMHPDVVRKILQLEPSKIVYVSCNPATQARDLALLEEKYRITKVQPVDMFPQTHHVENVVLMELL